MYRTEVSNTWIYHVAIPIAGHHFLSRLQVMDKWLTEWEIPYRVIPTEIGDSALLIGFPTERFARAFILAEEAGGTSVSTGQQ
ncbi:hypothetical protein AB4Z40_35260 [Bosea sp. 2YAB26]|uniref:hypothetical protein n=1 Tax=Bosea sp. 2YAB26 TaxID=3237478 RepID=UPI003F90D5F6